jgi:hypothetical protein
MYFKLSAVPCFFLLLIFAMMSFAIGKILILSKHKQMFISSHGSNELKCAPSLTPSMIIACSSVFAVQFC